MPPQAPAPRVSGCAKNLMLPVRQSVLAALPTGYRLTGVSVTPVCVPAQESALRCEAQLPHSLRDGQNAVSVQCAGKTGKSYVLTATVDLQATVAAKAAVVMARGAEVKVVVRSGNVTV